ncbi:unnamed protein product [Echinostoma caproni]|uniref:Tctex1 domain-containing protein 2 n=1 Tax=Echinostoma caproni TaxID=27848 RepID=A0A183A7E5_9TREM|nr:unnamed protein product [Echinostoma caproni]
MSIPQAQEVPSPTKVQDTGRLRRLSVAQGVRRLSIFKPTKIDAQSGVQPTTLSPTVETATTERSSFRDNATPLVESSRALSFRDWMGTTPNRRLSQVTPALAPPPISILGILAAKRVSRRFLAAITGTCDAREFMTMRKISTLSSASFMAPPKPPTYQLGPVEPFNPYVIQSRIERLLHLRANTLPPDYRPERAASLCKEIANEVKFIMRTAGSERYRYVAFCVVMQRGSHMAGCFSRVLWNADTDRTLCAQCLTPTVLVCCTAYALYKE